MPNLRIAVPLAGGALSQHFGRSESFAIVNADPEARRLMGREDLVAPAEGHGSLAPLLKAHGVGVLITGHIGQGAQVKVAAAGIELIAGAPDESPEALVQAWLDGRLSDEATGCCGGHEHGAGEGHGSGGCGCSH